jgi:hypothetical protein
MNYEQRDSRFLREGNFLGLKFDEGWWFVQIIGTEYNEVKPWVLQNENGNRAEIGAQTASVENDEIQDANANNILEPEESERNLIHQVLYGIAPSRMQVFQLYGRNRPRAVQNYDRPRDPGAYISGDDSPYDNPSDQSEAFLINAMSPLRLQAFNPMDEAMEARLSFHVNKLRYTVITDRSLMKAMLQGQVTASFGMMGGGAQDSSQVGVPSWLDNAFGEDIYSTREILDADTGGGEDEPPLTRSAGDLANMGGGQ